MNEKAKSVMKFMEQNPEYKGKFVGWTKKDDLGISRVDDRWYECDEYLINFEDLKEVLSGNCSEA